MKALIIADVHYGWKNGTKMSLSDIVNKLEQKEGKFTKIIILGDLIDLWRRDISEVLSEYKDLIDYLESEKDRIVYCRGNHDYIIKSLLSERNINVVDNYIFDKNIFLHGDYLDYLVNSNLFVNLDEFRKFEEVMCFSKDLSGNILSKLWKIFTLIRAGFGSALNKKVGNEVDDKISKMNDLSSVLYGNYNKVIIGHFHLYKKYNKLIILPALCDGYVTIYENGQFRIVDLNKW